MTSTYPGAIDDFAESSPTYMSDPDATGRTHEARHDDVEAAIEQVEETLGVNPQGPNATVAERLDGISGHGGWTEVNESFIVDGNVGVGADAAAWARLFVQGTSGQNPLYVSANNGVATTVDQYGNLIHAGRTVPTVFWSNDPGRRLFVWDTINERWQMVYGDTGWRHVAADMTPPPGVTVVQASLRRIGNVVYLSLAFDASGAEVGTFYAVPPGFRFRNSIQDQGWAGMLSPTSLMRVFTLSGGSDLGLQFGADAGRYQVLVSYPSDDAWPSSLPGVAEGVIPTAENLLPGQADIDPDIPTGLTPDDDTSDWTVTYPDGPTP